MLLEIEKLIYQELELHNKSALKIINADNKLKAYNFLNAREVLIEKSLTHSTKIANSLIEKKQYTQLKINSIINKITKYEFDYEISAIEAVGLHLKKNGAEESFEGSQLYLGNGETIRLGKEKLHYTNLFTSELKNQLMLEEENLEKKVISQMVTQILNEPEYVNIFNKLVNATNECKLINDTVYGFLSRNEKIRSSDFPITKINLLKDNYEALSELSTFFAIINDSGFNLKNYREVKVLNSLSQDNKNKLG